MGRAMRNALSVCLAAALLQHAVAQNCVSLAGSTACPAFSSASISTNAALVGLYPFLAFVDSTESFDRQLTSYAIQQYVQTKYTNLFGCDDINLTNTSDYYARYTITFLCNGIVQNSRGPCGLTDTNAPPLCADSCAQLALSEEQIVSSSLCEGRNEKYADQLRADFTNCALPANSLSGACVSGDVNEPDDCGFSSNLMGLCNFCRGSRENGTDSCCLTSNASGRCENVTLPVFSSISDLFSTASSTSSPTGTAAAGNNSNNSSGGNGLSGGQIAGIVVGSILGFLLLLALIILAFWCLRRRNRSQNGSILNQSTPQRKALQSMTQLPPSSHQQEYGVSPGGRVTRMSALQSDEPPQPGPRNYTASTDPYGDSPNFQSKGVIGVGPHVQQDGSPSSNSQRVTNSSPGDFSSPDGVASGQSEQLPFFKDYYSNGDIHPGDKVSVLWAYQPRAGDEFELERGDMLKIVGIWDDGWATGVRIHDRAEEYYGKHKVNRDSGVSNGTAAREDSPPPTGEIKAFPLVCVCLPEAWKKTVEGDTSTESGSAEPRQI